jgi:hypothetical protein
MFRAKLNLVPPPYKTLSSSITHYNTISCDSTYEALIPVHDILITICQFHLKHFLHNRFKCTGKTSL